MHCSPAVPTFCVALLCLQMVQQPTSPRSSSGKGQNTDSESTLSPAWSVISGLDSDSTTNACLQSTLQYGEGLHHRAALWTADSSGSAGSDEDLYRAAQHSSCS